MCNHYEKNVDVIEWGLSAADAKLNAEAAKVMKEWHDHCYPRRSAGIITQMGGVREMISARWGAWVTVKGKPSITANSRGDRLREFPMWKSATKKRRCLIPASAYYEPGQGPVGLRGELRFHPLGRDRFFIAGIFGEDTPSAPPDLEGRTYWFSMITTEPNAYARPFHDRMPLALSDDEAWRWIGDEPLPDDVLNSLLKGLRSEQLTHPVVPS